MGALDVLCIKCSPDCKSFDVVFPQSVGVSTAGCRGGRREEGGKLLKPYGVSSAQLREYKIVPRGGGGGLQICL